MNHVVFFQFTDANDATEAAAKLNALHGVVPTLQSIETGVDQLRTGRSWDLCLITRFADQAAMDAYQVHPAHQEVLAWLKARAKSVAAVDWTQS